MLWKLVPCFVVILFVIDAWANPLLLPSEHAPLTAELSSRVMERASHLQDSMRDPRFPVPTVQDLETIRRVAQVLIMLGEQIIPAIIGEPPGTSPGTPASTTTEIPNDPVNYKIRS